MPENSPLDLNRAAKEELIALPGIGEVLAERIIQARPLHGLDDLQNLPGFTEAVLEKIRPLVTVAPPEAAAEGASAPPEEAAADV